MSLAVRTRERLQAAALLLLILALFPGCKGFGAMLKVVAVGAYVAVRVAAVAVAAAARSKGPSAAEQPAPVAQTAPSAEPVPTQACGCPPVEHGSVWCDKIDGQDVCAIQCDAGWVYRDGLCVPAT